MTSPYRCGRVKRIAAPTAILDKWTVIFRHSRLRRAAIFLRPPILCHSIIVCVWVCMWEEAIGGERSLLRQTDCCKGFSLEGKISLGRKSERKRRRSGDVEKLYENFPPPEYIRLLMMSDWKLAAAAGDSKQFRFFFSLVWTAEQCTNVV